ncbi:hypothetical protein ACWIVY_10945, partial [Ursidibacter sp. B-7004-1]
GKQAVTFHQFFTDIPLFALSLICRSKRTTNLSLSRKRARGIVQLLHNTGNIPKIKGFYNRSLFITRKLIG